jgi:hypothetical protein
MLYKHVKDKYLLNLFFIIKLKYKITKLLFICLFNFFNIKIKRLFLEYSFLINLYKKELILITN